LSALSRRTSRWRGVVTLIAAILLAAGVGQTSLGHEILGKAGLFEEPASYTSLAFLQPGSLPEQLTSKPVMVSFIIRNASDTAHDYQWSMSLVQGQQTRQIAAGTARVASGNGTAITRAAAISCTQGQVQIVVSLAHPAEHIDAWLACKSPQT
jgi:hypothetical protein